MEITVSRIAMTCGLLEKWMPPGYGWDSDDEWRLVAKIGVTFPTWNKEMMALTMWIF